MTAGARHEGVSTDIRRGAGRVLADAFAEDPWATYVLGASGTRRPRALARLMSVPVDVSADRGGLVLETSPDAGRRPVAVSTWVPADRRGVGLVAAARAGALALPLEVGPATMVRLVRDEADLDRVLEPHLEDGDAYLWVLGVAREHHGQGLGRLVVDRTCAEATARGFRRVVLNTDNPTNVAIYRRLGFEPLTRVTRPSGLTSHVLARRVNP